MGTVLLITFLFPQFLEFLFRDVLQQVLLDIILGRQLEAVFAYEEILLSLIENVHIHVEMARYLILSAYYPSHLLTGVQTSTLKSSWWFDTQSQRGSEKVIIFSDPMTDSFEYYVAWPNSQSLSGAMSAPFFQKIIWSRPN